MHRNPEFLARARAMYDEATERIKRLQAEIEEANLIFYPLPASRITHSCRSC